MAPGFFADFWNPGIRVVQNRLTALQAEKTRKHICPESRGSHVVKTGIRVPSGPARVLRTPSSGLEGGNFDRDLPATGYRLPGTKRPACQFQLVNTVPMTEPSTTRAISIAAMRVALLLSCPGTSSVKLCILVFSSFTRLSEIHLFQPGPIAPSRTVTIWLLAELQLRAQIRAEVSSSIRRIIQGSTEAGCGSDQVMPVALSAGNSFADSPEPKARHAIYRESRLSGLNNGNTGPGNGFAASAGRELIVLPAGRARPAARSGRRRKKRRQTPR